MTFLTVLLTLLIERVTPQYRPNRTHRWFDGYYAKLAGSSTAQWLMSRPWGGVVVLLPPSLLIAWLQDLSHSLGDLFALLFGVLVLLYSLGPRDLGDDAESFVDARDSGTADDANTIAQTICLSDAPADEPRRSFAVARALVVLANRQLTAPIFWFVLFGAVGAAAYRMIQLLAEHLQRGPCPPGAQGYADQLCHIADWAPARITAAGYAIAGNFDAVADAWRSFDPRPGDRPLTEDEHLLAATGLAALDTFPGESGEAFGDTEAHADPTLIPPVVEDALALVWRTLAIWVVAIGGGSLIAALA